MFQTTIQVMFCGNSWNMDRISVEDGIFCLFLLNLMDRRGIVHDHVGAREHLFVIVTGDEYIMYNYSHTGMGYEYTWIHSMYINTYIYICIYIYIFTYTYTCV